jgi:competence protein ComGC
MASNSEKKEKSLAEFVVIVVLVGLLMATFINFFIKNETQFTQAGFAAVAQTFNTKVYAVHAQWMMDKQPSVVYLLSLDKDKKQAVSVNKTGWIDVKRAQLPCESIWQLVMEIPTSSMKYPVSAIEVRTSFSKNNNKLESEQGSLEKSECRYVLLDGSYFKYNRAKGKVSQVIQEN